MPPMMKRAVNALRGKRQRPGSEYRCPRCGSNQVRLVTQTSPTGVIVARVCGGCGYHFT